MLLSYKNERVPRTRSTYTFVAPKAFGANEKHVRLSLTYLAFHNLMNRTEAGFGLSADLLEPFQQGRL
jgi:hypothetical protein